MICWTRRRCSWQDLFEQAYISVACFGVTQPVVCTLRSCVPAAETADIFHCGLALIVEIGFNHADGFAHGVEPLIAD